MKYILIFLIITGCMYEEVDGFRITKIGEVPISRRELEMSGKLLKALKEKDKTFLDNSVRGEIKITFVNLKLNPQDRKKENQYFNYFFNTEYLRNKEFILDRSFSPSDSLKYNNNVKLECYNEKYVKGCSLEWYYSIIDYRIFFRLNENGEIISSLSLDFQSQKQPRIKFLEIEKKIFQALRENRPELIFQKNLLEEYPCISMLTENSTKKSCWDEKEKKVKGIVECCYKSKFSDPNEPEEIKLYESNDFLFTESNDDHCPSFQKAFASLKEDDNSIRHEYDDRYHHKVKFKRWLKFEYPLSGGRKCYYSFGIRGDSPNELKIHDFDFLKM